MAFSARAAGAVLTAVGAGVGIAAAQDDAPRAGDALPTATEVRDALLEQLPPIVFGEDGIETLVVEGVLRPLRQSFTLHARGGDSYDLLVTAIDDAHPFIVGRDGTSLTYVPGEERGKVQLFPGLIQIHLALEEGRLRYGIAFVGAAEDDTGKRVIVSIDPGSILRGATEDLRVERGRSGRFRLTGASPAGTRIEIDVDPDASYPVTALRITPEGADEPALAITKLIVNGAPGPRMLGIPAPDALREHFDVEDLREQSDEGSLAKAMGATFAATGARLRMIVAGTSRDPAEKAGALRDGRERALLGRLARTAAE